MKLETIRQTPSSFTTTPTLRVLHLAGSRVSDFYYNLSNIYATQVVQLVGVSNYYALVDPDGFWQLGESLDSLSEKLSVQQMISQLPKEIDLVVPHMFCFPGMTSFRALFEDILGLNLVGAPSHCAALATNKAYTRSVVAASGVRVAKAQQLRQGDTVTMKPPFIVKPNSEDNSLGLTLVWREEEIEAAVKTGFKYDDTLLIEDYIPGRELRVGVLEWKGKLRVLPMIEYVFGKERPIRTSKDKFDFKSDGTPQKQPDKPAAKPVCPANVSPELFEKVVDTAKKAHIALGCRDYSLYDFRIHAQTNEPYLLEAGLFWSFSKISMISRMIMAQEESLDDVIIELWRRAAGRTRVACGSLFKYVKIHEQ